MAVLLFPLILHAVGLRIRQLAQFPGYSTMFLVGAALVIFLCRTDYVSSPWARSLISMERRWTQRLVSSVLLAPRERWLGKGNWVILASPYFIPAASLLMWLLSILILPAPLRSLVLGVGVAYHVASVIIQWKIGTEESRRLGWLFGVAFLIPANLFLIGAAYGFALDGFAGLAQFLTDIFKPLAQGLRWITQQSL